MSPAKVDLEGSYDTLVAMKTRVYDSFTWMINGSRAVLLFFLMYTVYQYGHIHLGQRKDDKPEFSTLTYFAMSFAGGASSTLFVYSMSEPLFHQQGNFFARAGYRSQDEIDMFAINMNITSWSLSSWLIYTIVAMASALGMHRFGLPPTFRSCFYPIFGVYTWGWIGDFIDGLASLFLSGSSLRKHHLGLRLGRHCNAPGSASHGTRKAGRGLLQQ
jgi:choline-glycine betaine transporter